MNRENIERYDKIISTEEGAGALMKVVMNKYGIIDFMQCFFAGMADSEQDECIDEVWGAVGKKKAKAGPSMTVKITASVQEEDEEDILAIRGIEGEHATKKEVEKEKLRVMRSNKLPGKVKRVFEYIIDHLDDDGTTNISPETAYRDLGICRQTLSRRENELVAKGIIAKKRVFDDEDSGRLVWVQPSYMWKV